jgi:hypothetical protein
MFKRIYIRWFTTGLPVRMRARVIKVREETFNELRRIKERNGHTSFDSVIKSLLRNHREMEASRGR